MIISCEQIKEAALGVAWVSEEPGGVRLHRFTREQETAYTGTRYERQIWTTAGIQLSFQTDSPRMGLAVSVSNGSSRNYFSYDVFCNGKLTGHIGNLDLGPEYPLGDYEKSFELGEGVKRVRIVFPWSVSSVIRKLELEDGALFCPIRPESRTVFFGDSITHGYDARFPSNTYMVKIAEYLGTEGFNKAMGGERFCPALARCREAFEPDLIFVAYGTNDWNGLERPVFENNCKEFFQTMHEQYPRTPVYALTPIWRKDFNTPKAAGAFEDAGKVIREMTSPYENVTVLDGVDFVPHEEIYFSDRRLHPNDDGFRFYAENLWKAMGNLSNSR